MSNIEKLASNVNFVVIFLFLAILSVERLFVKRPFFKRDCEITSLAMKLKYFLPCL